MRFIEKYVLLLNGILKLRTAFLKMQFKIYSRYPNHELIEDVGSGLNSYFRRNMLKRKGFNALLELAMSGHVSEVIIAHRTGCVGSDLPKNQTHYP
jgi:predicted site-specific integrase-resolvase